MNPHLGVVPVSRKTITEVQPGPGQARRSVQLLMQWDPNDPAAVALTFDTVRWVVDRSFLYWGCRFLVGEGDYRVGPADAGFVDITLCPPGGDVGVFRAPAYVVEEFLEATIRQLPLTAAAMLDEAAMWAWIDSRDRGEPAA